MSFFRRRITFTRHLESSRNGLPTLVIPASCQCTYSRLRDVVLSLKHVFRSPWTNWDEVYWNFSHIHLYSTLPTPSIVPNSYYILLWIIPLPSLLRSFRPEKTPPWSIRRASLRRPTKQRKPPCGGAVIGRLDIFRDRWSQVVVYYRPGPIKSRESDLDDDQVIARSVMMPKVSGIPE